MIIHEICDIFQGHDFQGKRQKNLTNSATVATVPPIIQPTPILQSGKNNPNRIINPDNGLFTNAGYIEKYRNVNNLGNHQVLEVLV